MDGERTIHLCTKSATSSAITWRSYRRGLRNQEAYIRTQREMQEDPRRRMRMVFILVAVVRVLAGVLLSRLLFAFT